MLVIRSVAIFLCSWAAIAATAPVLTYSTYLRGNFTPVAITADSSGNIYLAGSTILDTTTRATGTIVVKLNPQASQYVYATALNSQPNQVVTAISVDAGGNAYITGIFGVSPGPAESFLAKLDPNGNTIFSNTLAGGFDMAAQAIAVNAAGQIFVSGASYASGLAATPGAWSVSDSKGQAFLLKLDPTGSQILIAAIGIGGSAIALDASGDIYVAGTTTSLTYPTTAGVYQPSFPVFLACTPGVCMTPFQGPNQYVSKIDSTLSTLLYSTSLSGTAGTVNNGVAVDAGGNVYVTGVALAGYPFTVTAPTPEPILSTEAGFPGLPFLSKLDPLGQNVLFSIPVGGAGVQVDTAGHVYVGGSIGSSEMGDFTYVNAALPALANVPAQCLPNGLTIADAAYVSQADAASGDILGTQFLGGATLAASAVALSGSQLWIAGSTSDPNVLYTPGAPAPANVSPIPPGAGVYYGLGAYLGAVNFSQPAPAPGAPQIACILDAADLAPVGPASPYQLLALFGTGLGPAAGVSAPDSTTTTLGGTQVTFGATPAPLLYVSSTQVNLAVPPAASGQAVSGMQVLAEGGASTPLGIPSTAANPSLFMNDPESLPPTSSTSFFATALNADGSENSPTNPAQLGSAITVFVNGLGPGTGATPQFSVPVTGWTVISQQAPNPFVWQVELQLPPNLVSSFSCPPSQAPVCALNFSLDYGSLAGQGQSPVSTAQQTLAGVYVSR